MMAYNYVGKNGCPMQATSETAVRLNSAIWAGNVDLVRSLLSSGANPNGKIGGHTHCGYGWESTHLDRAMLKCYLTKKEAQYQIVEQLLGAGADPYMPSDGVQPALLYGDQRFRELIQARARA